MKVLWKPHAINSNVSTTLTNFKKKNIYTNLPKKELEGLSGPLLTRRVNQ